MEHKNSKESYTQNDMATALANSNLANERLLEMVQAEIKYKKWKFYMLFFPVVMLVGYGLFTLWSKNNLFGGEDYVAKVEINGEIGPGMLANANRINASLRKAFADENNSGVFLSINSPGGSPSESARIHDELIYLQKKYPEKNLVIYGTGSMTSGAYWIACADDEIHSMSMTMVGSIGVIMETFDFSKILDEYNVSKKVFTAGEHKHRLDPFFETSEEDAEKINFTLAKLHDLFKATVSNSRKERINLETNPKLFSGDFWLGEEALELGLVDSITTEHELLEAEFGTVNVVDYTQHPNMFDQINSQRVLADLKNQLVTFW